MVRALPELRTIPVLVLTGSDDRLTRPEHSRRMARDIGSSAELVVVRGAGHVVNQSRPVETNAALDRLLNRVRSAPAEVVQPVVVDPDVVPELVDDRDRDLLDEVVDVLRHQAQRDPVEADPVR